LPISVIELSTAIEHDGRCRYTFETSGTKLEVRLPLDCSDSVPLPTEVDASFAVNSNGARIDALRVAFRLTTKT